MFHTPSENVEQSNKFDVGSFCYGWLRNVQRKQERGDLEQVESSENELSKESKAPYEFLVS